MRRVPDAGAVEPLGPDSPAWRYCGDRRMLLLIGRVGYLQLMYPPLSAGVVDHSMDQAEREALYQEMLRCWRQFGLGVRDVPADYPSSRRYFDRVCEEELETTPAVRRTPGYRPTRLQRAVLRAVKAAVRLTWPLVPRGCRYMPRARTAFARG